MDYCGNMKIYYNATLICKSGDLDIKLFRIYSLRGVEIYQNLSSEIFGGESVGADVGDLRGSESLLLFFNDFGV